MQGLAPGILTSGGRQYATWSTTNKSANITIPAGFGNLKFQTASSLTGTGTGNGITTFGKTTGKWYWEITIDAATTNGNTICGISDRYFSPGTIGGFANVGFFTNSLAYRTNAGNINNCFLKNGSYTGTGTGCTTDLAAGMLLGFALDIDSVSPTLKFYINGSQVGATQSLATGRTWYPACGASGVVGNGGTANFGASTFVYYTSSGAEAAGYNPGFYI